MWPWLLIGYAILLVGFVVAFGLLRAEQDKIQALQEFDERRAYELCLSANDSRVAIREAFEAYTDALIAASAQSEERTPDEEARRQRSIAAFRASVEEKLMAIRPRDCKADRERG